MGRGHDWGDGRLRPSKGRMESERIATLRLMMAQEKGILSQKGRPRWPTKPNRNRKQNLN